MEAKKDGGRKAPVVFGRRGNKPAGRASLESHTGRLPLQHDGEGMVSKASRLRISDMRNLGPAVEKDLAAAGVTNPRQVHKLGAERSFVKMLEGRLKTGRSAKCCNALYLYAFYGAIHDLDWRAIPDEKKREFRRFTAELRRSGRYQVKS